MHAGDRYKGVKCIYIFIFVMQLFRNLHVGSVFCFVQPKYTISVFKKKIFFLKNGITGRPITVQTHFNTVFTPTKKIQNKK